MCVAGRHSRNRQPRGNRLLSPFQQPSVLQRHPEARKLDHAGAQTLVRMGQRRALDLGHTPLRVSYAWRVFCTRMMTVIGPTPRRRVTSVSRVSSLKFSVADLRISCGSQGAEV